MPLTVEETGHPCFGDRPVALADRCAAEGLGNAASTIRGLLDERAALRRIFEAEGGDALVAAVRDAAGLLRSRGLTYRPTHAISVLACEPGRALMSATNALAEAIADDPYEIIGSHQPGLREAAAELAQLRALVQELAEDVAAEVEARYPAAERAQYPTSRRRYERDMEVVLRARALVTK